MLRSASLLLLLCSTACATAALPLRPPEAAADPGGPVAHQTGTLAGRGELPLFTQSWRPRTGPVRGVLVVVHGLKDHSDRYAELATALAEKGFAVHALDLRGHGRSAGERVWVERFDDYVEDVDLLVKQVRAQEGDRPIFLLGHSMGGAIATTYVLDRKPALAGLVLSAAALGVTAGGATVGVTKATAAIAPHAGVFQLDVNQFSRDPAVVKSCEADPLVYQPGAPARTARELINAIDAIEHREEELTLPLLALHGTADEVTPPWGSQHLVERARSADKTLKLYPGLVHDLLHEPEKAQVLADVTTWLEAHAPAAGAP